MSFEKSLVYRIGVGKALGLAVGLLGFFVLPMLVDDSGQCTGLLSGGCLEADISLHAATVLSNKQACVLNYDLSKDADLIELCRHAALDVLEADQNLEKKENYPILSYLRKTEKGKVNWGRIS